MLLSSPIIVLFFLKFLWHPFSIVALRFNLETIISPPLTEVLQVKKGGDLTQRYNKTVSIYMEICL